MKTFTFLAIALIIFSGFSGQKKDKLFVYGQKIIGGKSAYMVDAQGNTKRAGNNATVKYYIYLQVPRGKEVVVTELWINGRTYNFSSKMAEAPVVIKRQFPGDIKSDTLVNATEQQVYNILQHEERPATGLKTKKANAKYPVIVYYTLNGKKCSLHAGEIKQLPELMMQ
jgi:hypothetical protein